MLVLYEFDLTFFVLLRHKGTVADLVEGKSKMSINLDDGRSRTVELGKHGVRFVPKKPKHSEK